MVSSVVKPGYIVLDTNVFYNDWFLSSANLRYLFHYISNEDCTLLLPELVCEEVENIHRREIDALKLDVQKQWKRLAKLNNRVPDLAPASLDITYSFKELLAEKCENVHYIGYEAVSHTLLVKKALKVEKPFTEGEKGYRDALIWLSLLQFLKDNEVEHRVAYITNNKSDFFAASSGGLRLHEHLLSDIAALNVKAEIVPYDSLFKFVEAHVDKQAHSFDRPKTLYLAEDFLEESAVDYIESAPVSILRGALELAGIDGNIASEILSIGVEIMEGVEDFEILTHQTFDRNNVYLYLFFDLRIAYFTFKFSASSYYANKDAIDRQLMNLEIEDEYVKAGIPMRTYFDVSCILDPIGESFSNFTVSSLSFRV